MDQERDFQRAKELAINYISYRPRSSKEVSVHLIHKGYPIPLVDQVVNYLQENSYLNDQVFAEKWYLSRLNKGGYGPFLIYKELIAKGISPEICKGLRERLYPEKRESEEAMRLIGKTGLDKGQSSHQKRRLYQMLLRRGFSSGIALDTLGAKDMENE